MPLHTLIRSLVSTAICAVALAPGATIGYLAQAFDEGLSETVGAIVSAAQADFRAGDLSIRYLEEHPELLDGQPDPPRQFR